MINGTARAAGWNGVAWVVGMAMSPKVGPDDRKYEAVGVAR